MKILVTENQYRKILSEEKEQKVLRIPSLKIFDDNWDMLQKFLELKGNPPYSIGGNLDLSHTDIESLGNLKSVGGNLYLRHISIESLGNLTSVGGDLDLFDTLIESLGNLQSVGGYLDLYKTPIESLGNLKSVGGFLNLPETPLSTMYTKKEIRDMVSVGGKIYLSA